jgi:hypothetical protein
VHTAKITANDYNNNTNETYVNVTVYVNEEEAGNLTDVMIDDLDYGDFTTPPFDGIPSNWGDPWENVLATISTTPELTTSYFDRFDINNWELGMEYMSKWESITEAEKQRLETYNAGCHYGSVGDGKYVIPITPSTSYEFNITLWQNLKHLRCDCLTVGALPYGPSCT